VTTIFFTLTEKSSHKQNFKFIIYGSVASLLHAEVKQA